MNEPEVAVFVGIDWAHEKGINVHIDNPGILEELGKYKHGFPVSIRFTFQSGPLLPLWETVPSFSCMARFPSREQ